MISSSELSTIKGNLLLSEVIGRNHRLIKSGQSKYICLCPFHYDTTPSLYIYDKSGQYHCYTCKAHGDMFDFLKNSRGMDIAEAKEYLGVNDKIDNLLTEPVELASKKERLSVVPVPAKLAPSAFADGYSAIYRYTNREGELLYQVARYEAKGDKKKFFLPATHTASGWIPKAPTEERVLYNLLSLKNPGMGFIFEGEKCVDVGKGMIPDRAVVTWMGGFGAIKHTDMTPLQDGRKWAYWPDNDDGGIETAHYLATIIENLYIVPIPEGKPKGWDIADATGEDGWTDEQVIQHLNTRIPYHAWTTSDVEKQEVSPAVEQIGDDSPIEESHHSIFPAHLLDAPGLIGMICKEIVAKAVYPRPVLALGAAISCVGMIMGHNIKSESDLRTNVYILGMANSGAGKNWPRVFIKKLLAKAGIMNCCSGAPVSGAAVLTSAAKNNGKGIILWDEFGISAGNIAGKNSSPHQQQIFQMLMEFFTSSNDTFVGSEYANRDGKTPRIDIEQPCLNIFATTVKSTFFSSISSKQSMSGFIPRWLMLDDTSDYKMSREDLGDTNPSEALIEEVIALNMIEGTHTVKPGSNPADLTKSQFDITPITIPFSPESKAYLRQFEQEIVDRQNNNAKNSSIGSDSYCAIWARAREYAIKLALCGHSCGEIDLDVMKWAVELVTYCINATIAEIAISVSDNEQEAFTKKIFEIIRPYSVGKNYPGITKNQLTRKSQWVRAFQRDDIIKDLEVSHQIESVTNTINNKTMTTYYLYGKAPVKK